MTQLWKKQRWKCFQPLLPPDLQQAVDHLNQQLRVGPLVARLLVQRGVTDPDTAGAFLNPKLMELHEPLDIPGLEVAANRLLKAVRDKQRIIIYGDYDVDGITASSILYHVLSEAGADVETYVPHRIEEGYGLNCQAIESLCDQLTPGPDGGVIVTVDCGVTGCEPARVAKARQVDLIITDHHHFDPDDLPEAMAIVHPRLPGSKYPFAELCGAGVALKVAWAFARLHCGSERLPARYREMMLDMLSLAALGTVADVVPLVGENRVITTYGLGRIKDTAIAGLNALIDVANLRDEKVDAYHVGFTLGPRLNACGRMGHASQAVELLTRADTTKAEQIARFLTSENDKRRLTEKAIVVAAKEMVIEQGYDQDDQRVIIVAGRDWHRGVVGIVASRLVDAFSRPAIVLNIDEEGIAHGSARSVDGLSIHDALAACSEHLTTFGGHSMAAGMHLPAQGIDAFREAMVSYVNQRLTAEQMAPVIRADLMCTTRDLDEKTVAQIQRLAPFGRANELPLLGLCNLRIAQPPNRMGQKGNHLSLILTDDQVSLRAVGFGLGELAPQLAAGSKVDIVTQVKLSHWQGRTNVELMLKGIRPTQGSPEQGGWEIEPLPVVDTSLYIQ